MKSMGNILAIYGDILDLDAFIRVASRSGYNVLSTNDPKEFTEIVKIWAPAVIVVGLEMPNADGIKLLQTLPADRLDAHIILSGHPHPELSEAAMRLGREHGFQVSGLLPTPVRAKELAALLERLRGVSKDQLAADLPAAITGEDLFLEYQPKFDCSLGKYTGVEALIRWRHPVYGQVPAREFVVLAEEMGLIGRLTDRVVAAAARQAADWHCQGIGLDVSVNISARDTEDAALPERLHEHCRDAGVEPGAIILELTEASAIRRAPHIIDVLTRLRQKGFRLSIDDFGTGYSSIAQLQGLPFSELKIDRSFIAPLLANSGCRMIAEIVTALARKLSLKTVAEGVEDCDTLCALAQIGCDIAQGYYLSPPLPPDRLAPFIREQVPEPLRGTLLAPRQAQEPGPCP